MTFLISMVPVVELRGGLPYGILQGLSLPVAACAAILGNMLPVPFILAFIERIFAFLRRSYPKMDTLIGRLEKRAGEKQKAVDRYGAIGLVLLVAIPLPGTGAWTGSLVAALMRMKPQKAMPLIFSGVLIAAVLMTVITKLGIFAFF